MKKLLTILVMTMILGLLILFIILPKKEFSEIENRSLASVPKLTLDKIIDGSYMEDIEEYINDHFPIRNFFMNIRTISNKLIGKQNISDVYFGSDGYLLEKYDSLDNQDKLITTINKFYTNNSDINVNVMFVPNKIYVYHDKLPRNVDVYNQSELIDNIYNLLDDNINKIKLSDILLLEKENYQLYYKTDHHWTSYGAYIGYREFVLNNNINYIDISEFEIEKVTDSFMGSTYSKVVDPMSSDEDIMIFKYRDYNIDVDYVQSNKQEKTLYNYDYLDKKDKYAMFLDNNHPLITVTNNDINDDSNILLIKDSYANSMVPFLVNHYSKIHVIDPRYYKRNISNYIEENDIQNVLFLYNIGTLVSDDNILSVR